MDEKRERTEIQVKEVRGGKRDEEEGREDGKSEIKRKGMRREIDEVRIRRRKNES